MGGDREESGWGGVGDILGSDREGMGWGWGGVDDMTPCSECLKSVTTHIHILFREKKIFIALMIMTPLGQAHDDAARPHGRDGQGFKWANLLMYSFLLHLVFLFA